MEETKKFYSQRAIGIATYLGGPLAAGILIRKNFLNLGKEKHAINSLIIGIISTLLLFWGMFQIPEHIIDMVPNALIPLIYTGIVYLIVDQTQGVDLKSHKESSGEFFSNWKAGGIGLFCLTLIMGGLFGTIYLSSNDLDWDSEAYNQKINEFTANENLALMVYDLPENSTNDEIIEFINSVGIPKWRDNLRVITELNNIENLPIEFKSQNDILEQYCNLRIESYNLIKNSFQDTELNYDDRINKINIQIEKLLSNL